MSKQELALLKELVRMGFDMEFSRRCDDFDMALLQDFGPIEIATLSRQFGAYNGDPENYEHDRFYRVGMPSAGKFLFDKLLREWEPKP